MIEGYKQNVPSNRNLQRSCEKLSCLGLPGSECEKPEYDVTKSSKNSPLLFVSSPFLFSKSREREVPVSKLREEKRESKKKPTTVPSLKGDSLPETGPGEKRFNSCYCKG